MPSPNKTNHRWEVKKKTKEILDENKIIKILLENRGIAWKERNVFFNPVEPNLFTTKDWNLKTKQVEKSIERIKKAKKKKEKVIVFGDYDADGICATAILWEHLFAYGLDVLPYIPERFSEGYGISVQSIKKLLNKDSDIKLIVTVDNGIVAYDAIEFAGSKGIDIIVTDHHQKGKKKLKAYSIIHTNKTSGSAIAWFFANKLKKNFPEIGINLPHGNGLDLCAIGTVADQITLVGINRSIVKYGLDALRITERVGLLELLKESKVEKSSLGTYSIGFIIAPRINAMGRLEHAIDSLRLLCTKNPENAVKLAQRLGKTNLERQKIVEEVVIHSKKVAEENSNQIIVVAHESYHEGVIGLAASKLVEEYYRPAIVLSINGTSSKASGRSITGFNIIEAIQSLDNIIEQGGGHPMAAGFSIETAKIEEFSIAINDYGKKILTKKILTPSLKADLELDFKNINYPLVRKISEFEPLGMGNPAPSFVTNGIKVLSARTVGSQNNHLKLKLEKNKKRFDAIAFGMGEKVKRIADTGMIDVLYSLEENYWNGDVNIQLKIRDLKIA